MKLYVDGIGVLGQGLPDWPTAEQVLSGRLPRVDAPVARPLADILPPGERRRSTSHIKLAVHVAKQAVDQARVIPNDLVLVFASSNGDTETNHNICEALARPEREISPTRFHNSVHNVASGYWSIATGCRQPATSISAWDDTFAAGLLEAAAQATVEGVPVLLAAYDIPFPPPLAAFRPARFPFGVAMVLAPEPGATSLAELDVGLGEDSAAPTAMEESGLEALRLDIPAGRSLPLLAALAKGRPARLILGYAEDLRLQVDCRSWG